jgi:hypothetical protein
MEIRADQTDATQRLASIQTNIGRAVQQTRNSFSSIVAEATALSAFIAERPDAFVAEDAAFLGGQIAALADTVDTVAAELRALVPTAPSGD